MCEYLDMERVQPLTLPMEGELSGRVLGEMRGKIEKHGPLACSFFLFRVLSFSLGLSDSIDGMESRSACMYLHDARRIRVCEGARQNLTLFNKLARLSLFADRRNAISQGLLPALRQDDHHG